MNVDCNDDDDNDNDNDNVNDNDGDNDNDNDNDNGICSGISTKWLFIHCLQIELEFESVDEQVRFIFVFISKFFGPGTPTPPPTCTDQVTSSSTSSARLSPSPKASPKEEKKPKQKSKNGEMPEWMVNFVETNNLIVGKDVKLDESKTTGRRRSWTANSGTGTAKAGTRTGTGTGAKTSGTKPRASPGVARRGGTSPVGSRSPGGRPVTPGKATNRKSVPH